jgi:CHAT domain-containing protein
MMKVSQRLLVIGLILIPLRVIATTNSTLLQQADIAFQQGDFKQAINNWETVLQSPQLDPQVHIDTLIHLAVAQQMLGNYLLSSQILQQALSLAKSNHNVTGQILIQSHLGDVLLAMQQPETAKEYLNEGIRLAQQLSEPSLLAHLQNNLGNVLSIQLAYSEAILAFTQAADLARQQNLIPLLIQALSNQAKVYLKQKNFADSLNYLEMALDQVRQQPNTLQKGFQLLTLAKIGLTIQQRSQNELTVPFSLPIYQLLQEAQHLATQFQDKRLLAYSKGYLAQIYQHNQRYEEAMQLTREAIFISQDLPDLLYYWEWQQGRLLQAQQQLEAATQIYQQALDHLQPIRTHLMIGQRDTTEAFYERIRPVYYSLADVLLQQATTTTSASQPTRLLDQAQSALISASQPTRLLNQARNTIEQLKVAELQNYFQNECVSELTTTNLDQLDKKTAVIYPILLTDRTELLVSLPDGIHRFVVSVPSDVLTQVVVEFQKNLQTRTNFRFIQQARQLYDWLIHPFHEQLVEHHINTLVIVPDGPLRMIPMAALYNNENKHFLIEDFAIATTPSLNLTEPRHLPKDQIKILLNGLSKGVQDFAPLPNVPQEIKNIQTLFTESTVLLDQSYLLIEIKNALQQTPYSIVHIASHGQFDRNPKKTFVLTYDDKLTMDRLENLLAFSQSRQEPVELLTLSACQTAVGDEQSALGLAGVAIKAGARSALASLWFVNDEATSVLISEFYQELKKPGLSRAQALQNAQEQLISRPDFRHPAYWAAFLLIGSWL